jgi:hypothetical protein
VGPVEDSTCAVESRKHGAAARPRPRMRGCLLKGCEQRFRPRSATQRYCSVECCRAARRWSRWKAQQSYRSTAAGKDKRNQQSHRYRERVKARRQEPYESESGAEPARVITQDFFRSLLRSSWLLRRIRVEGAITQAAVLLPCLPACHGTGLATRTPLAARGATAAADLSCHSRPR